MSDVKRQINSETQHDGAKALVFKRVATVLVLNFSAATLNLSLMTVPHAAELKSASGSLAGTLHFDTSVGATNANDSLQNTPRYLWVSDKLSLKSNASENKVSGRSSFASGAEYWAKSKWGLSANFSSNDSSLLLGIPKNSKLLNVDVNRQLLRSKNKKNYLAVGLGWQNITVDDNLDANGLRLSLLGKYSLANRLQVYGASSWFPELERVSSNSDLSGYNLEAGLLFKPKASISLQAGFRFYDFSKGVASIESGAPVFTLGTKLSF